MAEQQEKIRLEVEGPVGQLPILQLKNVQSPPKDEPVVKGYTAKDLLKAPLQRPRPSILPEERHATRFMGGMEAYRRITIIVGAGCFAIGVLGIIFLSAPLALAMMIVGILLIVGAFLGKMFQSDPQK